MPPKAKWTPTEETVRLALQSHKPAEAAWPPDAAADEEATFVCSKDGQDWPCATIVKAQKFNSERRGDGATSGGSGAVASVTNF